MIATTKDSRLHVLVQSTPRGWTHWSGTSTATNGIVIMASVMKQMETAHKSRQGPDPVMLSVGRVVTAARKKIR